MTCLMIMDPMRTKIDSSTDDPDHMAQLLSDGYISEPASGTANVLQLVSRYSLSRAGYEFMCGHPAFGFFLDPLVSRQSMADSPTYQVTLYSRTFLEMPIHL